MFLQNLRTQTGPCHKALEQNPYSVALTGPEVTLADYSAYLQKLYGFVVGFEQTAYPLLQSADAEIESRRKTHFLQSDLSALNCNINSIPLLPEAVFKERYATPAAAWGGLYVLEGSVLGGAILKKHLQHLLGETIDDKVRYFTAYGVNTGQVWKNFLQLLGTAALEKEEEIIHSAVQTFGLLNQWMTFNTINSLENEH